MRAPGGKRAPAWTSAPAPTIAPSPMTAPTWTSAAQAGGRGRARVGSAPGSSRSRSWMPQTLAAIDDDLCAGDEGGGLAGEEQHRTDDVGRRRQPLAERNTPGDGAVGLFV